METAWTGTPFLYKVEPSHASPVILEAVSCMTTDGNTYWQKEESPHLAAICVISHDASEIKEEKIMCL